MSYGSFSCATVALRIVSPYNALGITVGALLRSVIPQNKKPPILKWKVSRRLFVRFLPDFLKCFLCYFETFHGN